MKPLLIALAAIGLAAHAAGLEGEKLDSGLGELPHYSQWLDKSGRDPVARRVLGESLDDGLGELPPYSKWLDKTGRDPMGRAGTKVAAADKR